MHTMKVRGVRTLFVAVCLAGLAGTGGTGSTAQKGASIRGRVEIGVPVTARRPSAAYTTRAVTQPVLVLDGDASFNFMTAAADAVAAELPNASRKTLAGQDHGPKPEVMALELRAFLPH